MELMPVSMEIGICIMSGISPSIPTVLVMTHFLLLFGRVEVGTCYSVRNASAEGSCQALICIKAIHSPPALTTHNPPSHCQLLGVGDELPFSVHLSIFHLSDWTFFALLL